jgi:hypothetical protein
MNDSNSTERNAALRRERVLDTADTFGQGIDSVDAGLSAAASSVLASAQPGPDLHSGAHWRAIADAKGWTNSKSLEDLSDGFRTKVTSFLSALQAAKASTPSAAIECQIETTTRHEVRAWLMHWAWIIKEGGEPPTTDEHGTGIIWTHDTAEKTRAAASEMAIMGFGMAYVAALDSLHIRGDAIDVTIEWQTDFDMKDAADETHAITGAPRHGGKQVGSVLEEGNSKLHTVAATYGVIKLKSDAPHWSATGR